MAVPPMKLTGDNFNTVFADGTVHRGLDITPTQGNDAVVSPVRGKVIDAGTSGDQRATGTNGLGPAWLKIQSLDDASIHTLAHLDIMSPSMPLKGTTVDEGEQVGLVARNVQPSKFHSGVAHVHWEVAIPPSFERVSPAAWLTGRVNASTTKPVSKDFWLWLIVGLALSEALRRR